MKHVQKIWEVQTRRQVKFNKKTHSSILRLSLRQYVEQRTDITFTLFPVSLTFWNLCSASAIQPNFIQSHLICYLSLCTSATQLMCEPCNVLQSGPRFDFIQPFFSFWNLCSASAIQLPMDLCNAFAIQPISFFRCKSKLSQFNSFPWHESSNFSQWLRPPCSHSTQIAILKSQIPSFAFHSEPHANAQTTLPLYPSLRIFCKFPMLQILSNSMPAFW